MGVLSRRDLVALLTFAPSLAFGQTRARMPVVGILWHGGSPEQEVSFRTPLMEGFEALGYVAGQSIRFEERYAAEVRFDELARELIELKPHVLVAVAPQSAMAVKQASANVPTVFVAVADPVSLGLVASLAKPGGMFTGISTFFSLEVWGKRVQLLKQALPHTTRFAVVSGDKSEIERRSVDAIRLGAERLELSFETFAANTADELFLGIEQARRRGFDALMLGATPLYFIEKKRIAELATTHRLATVAPADVFGADGALISYGASFPEIFRRAASFVDKILKGGSPAEIPVEQPSKYSVIVNLQTAKALGLELPLTFLNLADRIIE